MDKIEHYKIVKELIREQIVKITQTIRSLEEIKTELNDKYNEINNKILD